MAGPGTPIDTFADDARALDENAFGERHGRAFLVFATPRLTPAYGPEATRSLSSVAVDDLEAQQQRAAQAAQAQAAQAAQTAQAAEQQIDTGESAVTSPNRQRPPGAAARAVAHVAGAAGAVHGGGGAADSSGEGGAFIEAHELSVLPLVRELSSQYPFISVGRTRENDVILRDASVSKFQAYFKERAPGMWQVRDCNSRNGTHVDGVKISHTGDDEEPALIKSGSVVKLGGVEATFLVVKQFMDLVVRTTGGKNRIRA